MMDTDFVVSEIPQFDLIEGHPAAIAVKLKGGREIFDLRHFHIERNAVQQLNADGGGVITRTCRHVPVRNRLLYRDTVNLGLVSVIVSVEKNRRPRSGIFEIG